MQKQTPAIFLASAQSPFYTQSHILSKPQDIWRAVFPSTWRSSGFAKKVSDKTWSDLEDLEVKQLWAKCVCTDKKEKGFAVP